MTAMAMTITDAEKIATMASYFAEATVSHEDECNCHHCRLAFLCSFVIATGIEWVPINFGKHSVATDAPFKQEHWDSIRGWSR